MAPYRQRLSAQSVAGVNAHCQSGVLMKWSGGDQPSNAGLERIWSAHGATDDSVSPGCRMLFT